MHYNVLKQHKIYYYLPKNIQIIIITQESRLRLFIGQVFLQNDIGTCPQYIS